MVMQARYRQQGGYRRVFTVNAAVGLKLKYWHPFPNARSAASKREFRGVFQSILVPGREKNREDFGLKVRLLQRTKLRKLLICENGSF
jgi:hypothetical protein